jgi:elongator complex protein 1
VSLAFNTCSCWDADIFLVSGEWKKAFVACRKHRIDLAVLVNDTKSFLASIPTFVRQIDDVDFFGLFLTTIS